MKRRFRSTKKVISGETRTITWTHTDTQALILRLYFDFETRKPKFGVSNAFGELEIGEARRTSAGHLERVKVISPYTLYSLADHVGYTLSRVRFQNRVTEKGIGVPDEVAQDMRNGAKERCYKDVQRLRAYFQTIGMDGITCYFYFVWKLELAINEETGAVEFGRSPDQYLSLIPTKPLLAAQRYGLSDTLLYEMSVSTAFIIKRRLRHRDVDVTERRLRNGVPEIGILGLDDYQQFLTTPLLQAIVRESETEEEVYE